MRASRLVSLLCLLQVREVMTGPELARELEVSERTVARDVLALAAAGVPVYAERGRTGGYRLLGGYRAKLTGLHQAEAEALFLAGVPGPAIDMGLGEAVTAARLKASAALAPPFRDAPQRVGQRFHLDAPRWFREAETPAVLPELSRAVWRDRKVVARYRRRDREVRRELEPHGLVLKAGVWYLAARCGQRFLTYRVDRFSHVEVADEEFTRDETFDLPAFWEEKSDEFNRSLLTERIRIRISPAGLRKLHATTEGTAAREAEAAASEPDAQGWVTADFPVESLDVAYDQILNLGPEAEVLAPPDLRNRLAGAATRLAALYRDPGEGHP
ncbi:YafY family protein [Saccharopolyspora sp. ASAGF58]|uniref:helix-turn-helix transcriptional regulator n=1 Tax=Saccharopolyspora sp. ASAGF58 TaxID=2719023 RepID=UPI001440206F|nr:WYL domain-containing protein [Saccharopolyspora sp. ASAGF58]QIZ34084.1 WYL domain-containing protein [Saccharopolyspora sp. ASAGF58]